MTFITGWMLTFTTHREGDRLDAPNPARDDLLTEDALHDAIDAHGPAVYRYAMSHVGPSHAEDVMAETFAAAWKSRAKFVDASNNGLEAWLIGIARTMVRANRRAEHRWLRSCVDALRHRADATSTLDDDDTVARVDAVTLFRQSHVVERIQQLHPRERDPLLLHVLHGFQYHEIAEQLGIPIGTVQSRISRGRRRLLDHLRAEEGGLA